MKRFAPTLYLVRATLAEYFELFMTTVGVLMAILITVSELQAYVIDQVRKLTAGGQNPTVRRENLESDFVVY